MITATPLPRLLQLGIARLSGLRANLQKWRGPLALAAAAVFLGGIWYSFLQLGLAPGQLALAPLATQLALAPLSLLYAAIGLQLLLRSAGARIGLGNAMTVSSWAALAEALPVPGGALVRTGALVAAGAGLGAASALVLLTAVLWISLAALGCGLALLGHDQAGAAFLALAGLTGSGIATGWLIRSAGWQLGLLTLAHRLSGLALIAVRLHFAFLTLGVMLPLRDAMPFALANIAGSAAAIAPAGLGISEAIAAAIAPSVAIAAAAAFLAVGLDRLVCLGASAMLTLAALARRHLTGLTA